MRGIELLVTHKIDQSGIAVCLKSKVPPVLTPSLVHDVRHFQNILAERFYANPWDNLFYVVWYLCSGKISWNGLDFNFIHSNIRQRTDKNIVNYIQEVFDLLFLNYVSLGLPLVNCSIITRPLKGMSQEFFWLNQINFIKKSFSNAQLINKNICQIDDLAQQGDKKGCFPGNVYRRNLFYHFHTVNYSEMKNILNDAPFEAFTYEELEKTRLVFESMKKNTLVEIYSLASKSPNLFERMSRLQMFEHISSKKRVA